MNTRQYSLPELGWTQFYQSQLSIEEFETARPARVVEVQRSTIDFMGQDGAFTAEWTPALFDHGLAVGDWVLFDGETGLPERVLDRKSALKRRAAGEQPSSQLIAANVDTLFIVSSCNADFNTARNERYLALARQAGVEPVLVLTKADLTDEADDFRRRAERDLPGVLVETIDATSPDSVARLAPWCGKGSTLALVGSSGVGKTTLTNTLTGEDHKTLAIREDDAKGRHTTTARSMYALPSGGWLIDTPGMRALRLYDVGDGVDMVFEDLTELAASCRFSDCGHDTEPGCAIQAAIASGDMDPARLKRWQKLQREDQFNTETLAERHARARSLARMIRAGKDRGNTKKNRLF